MADIHQLKEKDELGAERAGEADDLTGHFFEDQDILSRYVHI